VGRDSLILSASWASRTAAMTLAQHASKSSSGPTGPLELLEVSVMLVGCYSVVTARLTYGLIALIDYNLAGAGSLNGQGSHSHASATRPSTSLRAFQLPACSCCHGTLPEVG